MCAVSVWLVRSRVWELVEEMTESLRLGDKETGLVGPRFISGIWGLEFNKFDRVGCGQIRWNGTEDKTSLVLFPRE